MMSRFLVFIWLVRSFIFPLVPAIVFIPAAAAQECETLWLNGEVIAVDRTGGQFALRVLETLPGVPKEIVFHVASSTKFISGSQEIDFDRLDPGDKVSVLLCKDGYIGPTALRVLVLGGEY